MTRTNKTLPSVNGTLVQGTVNKSIAVSTLTYQMSGTFQIFINGTQLAFKANPNFSYSPNIAELKWAICTIYETTNIRVWATSKSPPDYSINLII